MQTQTIKLTFPEGFVFDKVGSDHVLLKQKPKDVVERIMTVADVLADNGLTQEQFDEQCKGLEPDEVAYRILKLLNKSLNEGWTPNENDSNEYKYFPWFYMGGSSGFRFRVCALWTSYSYVGSRLCYRSSELAEHAGKHFTAVYKQFMSIQ
jgi:hypothetical protein